MSDRVTIDPDVFRDCFNRKAFVIRHGLSDHPLFELPRLVELARRLPPEQLEYNAGNVPVGLDPSSTPGNGLSAEETVRRIEECDSWMVLKNVESDPDYADLLEACLDELLPYSESLASGMHGAEAFIFVSSPGSVTPFHIDPELNFLFQIRGNKTVSVFDPADRELVSDLDLERFFSGAHRNLRFEDRWQHRAMQCRLQPGTAVHVPVTAPHWVKNGDDVSISFSVTFRSKRSKRLADAHQMNHRLRRMGLRPAAVGSSLLRDWVKQSAGRLIRRSRRWVSG